MTGMACGSIGSVYGTSLETFKVDGVEAICIKVTIDTQDSFAIVNAYVPPGETD